jgi:putative ABC transport system permease protein
VLGTSAALVGAALGGLGAWLLVTQVFGLGFVFLPVAVAGLAAGAIATTIAVGAVATVRLLGVPAAQALRTG